MKDIFEHNVTKTVVLDGGRKLPTVEKLEEKYSGDCVCCIQRVFSMSVHIAGKAMNASSTNSWW